MKAVHVIHINMGADFRSNYRPYCFSRISCTYDNSPKENPLMRSG